MTTVIRVEHLSKSYRLGQIGSSTLRDDIARLGARLRGKPDPLSPVVQRSQHSGQVGEIIWALNDVSFDVEQGEVLGIIGRNGAGKSTLLKILSRVTAPTTGVVKIKGRIASLLEVGTGFHPELTGRENIYLNGTILGMRRKEIESKFNEIVDFSGVEQFIDTPVKRYSSGMYVRLAFAVAAHLEPEILLVDEVLAVGDAEFQEKCLGKMETISQEGRTILFVSHNLSAIKSLCKRGIVLHEGKLYIDLPADEAVEKYLSLMDLSKMVSDYEVSNLPRIQGNGMVTITNVMLMKINGEITRSFAIWEPFIVELKAKCNDHSQPTSFWILINTSSGDTVLSSFQYDDIDPIKITKESIRLRVLIEPQVLMPGNYSISIGAFGKFNEFFDWIDRVIKFEIKKEFSTGKHFDHRLGEMTFHYKWEIIENE
jgi:lipopolysaccharide transport system ATP-binding protein